MNYSVLKFAVGFCPTALAVLILFAFGICEAGAQSGTQGEQVQNPVPAQSATCLLYTSPSPRDATLSRMPSSA